MTMMMMMMTMNDIGTYESFWSERGYFSLWLVWEFYLQLFLGGMEYRFFGCGRIKGTEITDFGLN